MESFLESSTVLKTRIQQSLLEALNYVVEFEFLPKVHLSQLSIQQNLWNAIIAIFNDQRVKKFITLFLNLIKSLAVLAFQLVQYLYQKYLNHIITGTLLILSIIFWINRKQRHLLWRKQQLIACRKELIELMLSKDCYPILLRLAWSDAATFDHSIHDWPRCGGANGSIRFDCEISHPSNAGLNKALQYLRPLRRKYRWISWADLIQMSGVLAVELCGGPNLQPLMKYGRLDAPIPPKTSSSKQPNNSVSSSYTISQSKHNYNGTPNQPGLRNYTTPPKARPAHSVHTPITNDRHSTTSTARKSMSSPPKNLNRQNSPYPSISNSCHNKSTQCLASRLPVSHAPYPNGVPTAEAHIRHIFYRMGFNNKEIVALCGAHTIGRAFADRSGVCAFSSGDQYATSYTKQSSIAKAGGKAGVGMAGGCSWTKNWLQFDNSYFRRTYNSPENSRGSNSDIGTISENDELLWLPTDNALYTGSEFRPHFLRYAKSKEAFFEDYALAHIKMSELGVRLEPAEGISLPHIDMRSYVHV